MISEVKFRQDICCFKAGDTIPLRDGVNVVVGANGCGKSTFVELVRSRFANRKVRENSWRSLSFREDEAAKYITVKLGCYSHIIGYDFERDSGRGAPDLQFNKMELQVYEMNHSHGEASLKTMETLIMPLARTIAARGEGLSLWLDEPDANLSPRSAYNLVRCLHEIVGMNHQVIVTAHNPIVITGQIPGECDGWDGVFDMETRRWTTPKTFLEAQAKR